jgi:hypothetical protein
MRHKETGGSVGYLATTTCGKSNKLFFDKQNNDLCLQIFMNYLIIFIVHFSIIIILSNENKYNICKSIS